MDGLVKERRSLISAWNVRIKSINGERKSWVEEEVRTERRVSVSFEDLFKLSVYLFEEVVEWVVDDRGNRGKLMRFDNETEKVGILHLKSKLRDTFSKARTFTIDVLSKDKRGIKRSKVFIISVVIERDRARRLRVIVVHELTEVVNGVYEESSKELIRRDEVPRASELV